MKCGKNANITKTNGELLIEPKAKVCGEKKTLGSIDLDDVERPLRVVEECMHRLELQHQLKEQARQVAQSKDSSDSETDSADTSEGTSESNKSEEYVLADATHDNPLMGRVSVRKLASYH